MVGLEPGESIKVKIACEDDYVPRFEKRICVVQRGEIHNKEEL
jgi:FKBP-type peptidyl-prolyl cis-trans isomerase 2